MLATVRAKQERPVNAHSMPHFLDGDKHGKAQYYGSSAVCDRLVGPSPIILLRNNDVLLGRGSIIDSHPGNERFRVIVQEHKASYLSAPKNSKEQIALEVIAEISRLDPPGRFLERRDGMYAPVILKRAVHKTMQALRERWGSTPMSYSTARTEIHFSPHPNCDVDKLKSTEQASERMDKEEQEMTLEPKESGTHWSTVASSYEPGKLGHKHGGCNVEVEAGMRKPNVISLSKLGVVVRDELRRDDQFDDAEEDPNLCTSLEIFQYYTFVEYRREDATYSAQEVMLIDI